MRIEHEIIKEQEESWNETHKMLSQTGSFIVQIVAGCLTSGFGGALTSGMSQGIAQTATKAAINAAAKQITASVLEAGITGNGIHLDVSSIATNALKAAVVSGLNTEFDSKIDKTINNTLVNKTMHATMHAATQSTVYGTNFKDSLKANLSNEASDIIYEQVGNIAMKKELGEGKESFSDGGMSKVALHTVAGGAASMMMGGSFATGAVAAGSRELLSPLTEDSSKYAQNAVAQIVGTLTGSITGGNRGAEIGNAVALSAETHNRQLHQREIKWIEAHVQAYAQELYGDNPTPEELADAQARLAQQALRGVDKGWSLKLGDKDDESAKAFLDKNNANLFTVKNEYEFKDGSTDGENEISDLNKEQFDTLNNFYQTNINRATTSNQEGTLRNANEIYANEKGLIDALKEGEIGIDEFNQAMRDFVPNSVEAISNIPDVAKSAGNFLDATLPTTNQERLDTLYGSHTDGSVLQANLSTADAISTAGMVTGLGTIGRSALHSIDNSIGKGVDEALDIDFSRPTINDNAFDSRPISNDEATKMLEERYINQGVSPEVARQYASETIDSFEGQITTRMVLDGDSFVVNHSNGEVPSGRYVVKKEDANTLPPDTRRDLALPNSNEANTQTEVTVTRPHEVLEGTVADQSHNIDNDFPPTATGGGQQTFIDPDATNRNEIFGDSK